MKLLLLSPGATWSTADVCDGLRFGLIHHGVDVVDYRLDGRIMRADKWLGGAWKNAKKTDPNFQKPNIYDVFHQAAGDVVNMALDHRVDAVVVVSGMFLLPKILVRMKRANLITTVLFTESPYDHQELDMAGLHDAGVRVVDGCWTNERSVIPAFRAVNPNSGYLEHGWHPERHKPGLRDWDADVPSHDVVFVGSAFQERVDWLSAIDWSGIDLGLYGHWPQIKARHRLKKYLHGEGPITNSMTSSLYRRAKIGLNLYRTSKGWGEQAAHITHAESLNPRAYELAACGAFHLSSDRAEVGEVFGDLVPTFRHPTEASGLIRSWLADPDGRARVSAALPACVAERSWVERATRVIGDLQSLLAQRSTCTACGRAA